MKPTIYDIAHKAGVSKSTVSRVLNHQGNISVAAKEKVLAAIKELNYEPSKLARGLTGGSFDAILALNRRSFTSTHGNPFFSEVIQAISAASEKNNFDLILQTAKSEEEELQKIKNKINERLIRGIIILSASLNEHYLDELDLLEIPIVIIGKVEKEYNYIYSVDTDNYHDSYKMVETLINAGHKKIACLHAPLEIHVSSDRLNGYRHALFDHQLPIQEEFIIDSGYLLEDALKASQNLLENDQLPTAVFATDALKALSFYQAAEKKQLAIPEDISLIAFNDPVFAAFFHPPLAGVTVPTQNLGKKATEVLFQLINGAQDLPQKMIVPTTLSLTASIANR